MCARGLSTRDHEQYTIVALATALALSIVLNIQYIVIDTSPSVISSQDSQKSTHDWFSTQARHVKLS